MNGTAVLSDKGCNGADITDDDGAVPQYVAYTAADGTQQRCIDYTVIDRDTPRTLTGGWYVTSEKDRNFGQTVTITGDVNLILTDGNELNFSMSAADDAIDATNHDINIYGQSAQSGTLNVTTGGEDVTAIKAGNLNIYGGNVTVSATSGTAAALSGNLALSGPATATLTGDIRGDVTIAPGQAFTDGNGHYYAATQTDAYTLTAAEKTAISGETLTFYCYGEVLKAKEATVNSETNHWTTFYNGTQGYAIDEASTDACAYTATVSGTTITLHRLGKVIPAGKAVIIVSNGATVVMQNSDAAAETDVENKLHGLDAATARTTVLSQYEADAILMLSDKNGHFGFHEVSLTNIPANKAFLALAGSEAKARQFTIVFEDATGISHTEITEITEKPGAWYTLNGVKLNGKPTKSGIYVNNGKKVVIK